MTNRELLKTILCDNYISIKHLTIDEKYDIIDILIELFKSNEYNQALLKDKPAQVNKSNYIIYDKYSNNIKLRAADPEERLIIPTYMFNILSRLTNQKYNLKNLINELNDK